MQISPIQQTKNYNDLSFQALKQIKYEGFFDPKNRYQDKKIVDVIKNSESFKKFFKDFDTWLTLENTVFYKNTKGIFYILKMKYRRAEANPSKWDKIKDFLKIEPKENELDTIIQVSNQGNYSSEAASIFEEKLKNFTFNKMMKEHQKNINKA